MKSTVYLIPSFIDDASDQTIPSYVLDAVKSCTVFYVENERSARRYLKRLWKEMVIDDYRWIPIHKVEQQVRTEFQTDLRNNRIIGIISEAGCPGIADPGQLLVSVAHEYGATVRPLIGPSSILLALMASGMNGQQFQFVGYLPIDGNERIKAIRDIEAESARKKCTMMFIETPYRNNQLLEQLLKTCRPSTMLSVAAEITSANEFIQTHPIGTWKKNIPELHKRPAIFSLLA